MSEVDSIIDEHRKEMERQNNDMIQSREALERLRRAYTSSGDRAQQTTKVGRQGSQTNNGLFDEEEQA